jgi:hypothetical protein
LLRVELHNEVLVFIRTSVVQHPEAEADPCSGGMDFIGIVRHVYKSMVKRIWSPIGIDVKSVVSGSNCSHVRMHIGA